MSLEEGLSRSSVVRDWKPLTFEFVPERMLHRDTELQALFSAFRVVLEGVGSQTMFVTGEIGTGKTALTKVFARDFVEAARKKSLVVVPSHVNCRKNASEGLVLLNLLQTFDKNYPERGYSTQEMLKDLRKIIQGRGVHLLAILDEADAFVLKGGQDLLYALSRFDEERATGKPSLSLILVSAQADLLTRLDEATRSTIKKTNTIFLKPYGARQLEEIVQTRVELAFHKGAVPRDTVELVAEIAADEGGNARYAIELLDGAARAADAEGEEKVNAEHVRGTKAHTHPFLTEAKLRNLGTHQLFVLQGIARRLKKSKKSFLTTGEAEEAYKLAAEEHEETARAHTQFWKYLKELEAAGILRLKKQEVSPSGLTQLISLPDAPATVVLEKLERAFGNSGRKE